MLDEEARERLLDYSVLRNFLYEQRYTEQRVRISQALERNKFALGLGLGKASASIFHNNSALPEVVGPNHIRMDLGKGNKLLSYADKQNLIHRHTVRKALAANMTSNRQRLNRDNNLELIKFILVYKGVEAERQPQPTRAARRSGFSRLELGHMVSSLNFNTVCNYVNLRRLYHHVCSYSVDFNTRDLNLAKFEAFVEDFGTLTRLGKLQNIAHIFNQAQFEGGATLSYEEFYEALKVVAKELVGAEDPLVKPGES